MPISAIVDLIVQSGILQTKSCNMILQMSSVHKSDARLLVSTIETGNWKLETGNWRLETENQKLEIGNWKLKFENWKLEYGNENWKLETAIQPGYARKPSAATRTV